MSVVRKSVGICLAISVFMPPASGGERILMSDSADLDGDGRTEAVVITYARMENGRPIGGDVVVKRDGQELWRQGKLNPWKLRIANLDGTGIYEIMENTAKLTFDIFLPLLLR